MAIRCAALVGAKPAREGLPRNADVLPVATILARKAIWQLLPSWTAIGVLLWQIDKVLLAEAAI